MLTAVDRHRCIFFFCFSSLPERLGANTRSKEIIAFDLTQSSANNHDNCYGVHKVSKRRANCIVCFCVSLVLCVCLICLNCLFGGCWSRFAFADSELCQFCVFFCLPFLCCCFCAVFVSGESQSRIKMADRPLEEQDVNAAECHTRQATKFATCLFIFCCFLKRRNFVFLLLLILFSLSLARLSIDHRLCSGCVLSSVCLVS